MLKLISWVFLNRESFVINDVFNKKHRKGITQIWLRQCKRFEKR